MAETIKYAKLPILILVIITDLSAMAQQGINKVILIGNLGADPDIRYTNSGQAVTMIQIATSETIKRKGSDAPVEKTQWHRIVIHNILGELAGVQLKKGAKVYIEGRLQTRHWKDQQGQDRSTTEVIASIFQRIDLENSQEPSYPKPRPMPQLDKPPF